MNTHFPPEHLMSEAVIQAELYRQFIELGANVTLEYSTPMGRTDLALFNSDWTRLIAIVEMKHNEERRVRRTPQIERYKKLGVPVYGLADIARAAHMAVKIMQDQSSAVGISISDIQQIPKRQRRKRSKIPKIIYVDECLKYREA